MVQGKCLSFVAVYAVLCLTIGEALAQDLFHPDQDLQAEAMQKFKKVFGISGNRDNYSDRIPPQYMLDLYNTVADPNGVTRANNPYNAKIIRSFKEKHVVANSVTYFNISGLSPYESVIEAELHVYRHKHHLKHSKLGSNKAVIYTVKVYQVLNYEWISTPEKNKLIDVHYVNVLSPGWEVFHIKSAVQEWLNGVSPNYGLILTASSSNGQKLDFRFVRHSEKHAMLQPMLVLFNNENATSTETADAEATWDHLKHNDLSFTYGELRQSNNDIDDDDFSYRKRRDIPSRNTECSLTELYVDFEKIGWSSWIISPKGYNANYCKGHCSYPLGQNQRPTNHATVQSIVHQLNLAPSVPQPCCVPSRLLSLSLLYYDDNDNVILKQYDDMVADSCGCH